MWKKWVRPNLEFDPFYFPEGTEDKTAFVRAEFWTWDVSNTALPRLSDFVVIASSQGLC
jgi:hypothetical protein